MPCIPTVPAGRTPLHLAMDKLTRNKRLVPSRRTPQVCVLKTLWENETGLGSGIVSLVSHGSLTLSQSGAQAEGARPGTRNQRGSALSSCCLFARYCSSRFRHVLSANQEQIYPGSNAAELSRLFHYLTPHVLPIHYPHHSLADCPHSLRETSALTFAPLVLHHSFAHSLRFAHHFNNNHEDSILWQASVQDGGCRL